MAAMVEHYEKTALLEDITYTNIFGTSYWRKIGCSSCVSPSQTSRVHKNVKTCG